MSKNKNMKPRIAFACLLLAGLPLTGNAQTQNPMAESLVKVGGQAEVVAQVCSQASENELRQAKEKQKNLAIQSVGISEAQFNQWYDQGYQEAHARWQTMNASERQKACSKVLEMAQPISR